MMYAVDTLGHSSELIQNLVEESLETGTAREGTIQGERSLYLLNNEESVIFRDPKEHVSTNTESLNQRYIESAELAEMKATFQNEINELRKERCTPCSSSPEIQDQQFLIKSLLSQVQFLQNTISKS